MNKYDLNEEQFEECLKRAELQVFLRSNSVEEGIQPISVFVIGQPGAGKTSLKGFVQSEYINEGIKYPFIEFNPDEVALYHEYYTEIQNEYPNESYQLLQKFVSPALDEYLKPKAIKLRNNVIQEGTFANKEAYVNMIKLQKNGGEAKIGKLANENGRSIEQIEGGYFIDINLLAVHRFESLLSCYEREYKNIEDGITPRAVTAENHDKSYNKVLNTMQEIEKEGLFDRIRVFKRGKEILKPQMVYCVENDTLSRSNIKQVMENQREINRQQLFNDAGSYISRINILKQKAQDSGNQVLFEKVEALEKEFITDLDKYNKERKEGR